MYFMLNYDLKMENPSNKKTAPLMIINEPAARALRLLSLLKRSEVLCQRSMTRAPEIINRIQPIMANIAFRRFSTMESIKWPINITAQIMVNPPIVVHMINGFVAKPPVVSYNTMQTMAIANSKIFNNKRLLICILFVFIKLYFFLEYKNIFFK